MEVKARSKNLAGGMIMKGIVAQVTANIRLMAENREPLHQFGL